MTKTLVAVLTALGFILWAPEAAPAEGGCDTEALARSAFSALGETQAKLTVGVTEPGVAGVAEPEAVTISRDLECGYVKSTIAHELAHVWQFRMIGSDDVYATLGHDVAEIVADCVAKATGWDDYSPYLTERGAQCSSSEALAASELKEWAR